MGSRPKVLLVDDDPLMHRLYQPHIERAGYEMLGLLDGSEASQTASRELPQVVVMDMVLPGTDGMAAIMDIKKNVTIKSIPVIAISANPDYHRFRQLLARLGADSFLSKPFSPVQLVSEIRRLDPNAKGG
jgi:DNA-binding response OmpR family regulator